MACHEMAWLRGAALLAALFAVVSSRAPTLDPVLFEAAFQGRCGEGSPCEQLCRELHDGTYECGCGPGYVLQVDGYGCLELNATKPTEASSDTQEDVLYQKDVSFSAELEIAPSNRLSKSNVSERHIYSEKRLTTLPPAKQDLEKYAYTAERSKEVDGIESLLENGVSKLDLNIISDNRIKEAIDEASKSKVTTLGPSLEQKVPGGTSSPARTTAVESCPCESCFGSVCSCPAPDKCKHDGKISTPRFSGTSWLALRALRGAYKRVRLRIRVRPERTRGVLLLTGEHDDLSGDYLALLLRNGHVELRFDCGSGAGVLRSPEFVRLGRWNTISVYRHRWDAWLRLNNGKRVRGRSMGLFSRMTFREPVWVGGAGNTTGLQNKLGLSEGLLGCVDFLRINGDTYRLIKDAVSTLDIGECAPTLAPWKQRIEVTSQTAPDRYTDSGNRGIYDINDVVHFEDNDIVMRDAKEHDKMENEVQPKDISFDEKYKANKKVLMNIDSKGVKLLDDVDNTGDDYKVMKNANCECQHSGVCVAHVCLCPLGYAGAKCEITLDLKVLRFNGSSYLRLPALNVIVKTRFFLQISVKPTSGDGLLMYDSDDPSGNGDFFSLHLRNYYVEFAFDLGSGIALVRSAYPLQKGVWHVVTMSRLGARASLRVGARGIPPVPRSVTSIGTARHLTLRQPMLLGGGPKPLPQRLALTKSFSGCIGLVMINDHELPVVSTALGGVNVENCNHVNACRNEVCKETLLHTPVYPDHVREQDAHHAIVSKKGFQLKYHKSKTKKHPHAHPDKKKNKKYIETKKFLYMQNEVENKDEGPGVATEKPYDGQTYMQIKYLDASEINWGDTSTYPSFSGVDSFIHIDDDETMKRLRSGTLDINVRFRARAPRGLVLWSGRAHGDFLALAVEDSVLVFRYDLGSGEVVIIANHTKVDDGLWHRARATRNRQAGVLEVDGLGSVAKMSPGKLKQLNTDNGLYIGGLPSIEINTLGKYKSGLIGCVSQISLSGDFDIPLSLSKLPHTITNNVGRCAP